MSSHLLASVVAARPLAISLLLLLQVRRLGHFHRRGDRQVSAQQAGRFLFRFRFAHAWPLASTGCTTASSATCSATVCPVSSACSAAPASTAMTVVTSSVIHAARQSRQQA